MTRLRPSLVDSIAAIGAADWNRLAGTDNPFMRYEFLAALEATDCTNAESGWLPRHIAVHEVKEGQPPYLVAAAPLYLKTNSNGEYVFDWSWAYAYRQQGMNYYPKLVTSAPFTPSTGRRFFIAERGAERKPRKEGEPPRPGKPLNRDKLMRVIRDTAQKEAARCGASSWHVLFPTAEEHAQLGALNLMPRTACQFHWHNRGYADFEAFLNGMNSRKRKNIRKERAQVQEAGIRFRRVEGADISEALWQRFYAFYQSTYLTRGMQGYLSPDFFHEMTRSMPEQLHMVCAEKDDEVIAAALFFKSKDTLFGRYWGCAEEYRFLHFETCFYQGQEYAIEHRLNKFDSGAQGEHKIQRGFEPVLTHSSHWIAHPAFRSVIRNFLAQESTHIQQYRQAAETLLPFKQDADPGREGNAHT